MFQVELLGQTAVIARMDALPAKVHGELARTIRRLTLLLQSHIQKDKLQGQVLAHRTGKLSRSIDEMVTDTPQSIVGVVFANGTAPYAHIHEYGFSGTEQVKAYVRTYRSVYDSKHERTFANVKAFSRKMNMPMRSFLRSSMKDLTAQIEREMQTAVTKGAQAKEV